MLFKLLFPYENYLNIYHIYHILNQKNNMSTSRKNTSERLKLVTAISGLSQTQEKFIKAVETLSEYNSETLTKLDLEINTKKEELEELTTLFNNTVKANQIKVDQQLDEYKYDGALEILKERSEVPILESELESLKNKVVELTNQRQEELNQVKETEKKKGEQAKNMAIRNAQLEHKAQVAVLDASVKQQTKEITNLQQTIDNLRHELSEQRKLTKEVAEAGKMGTINVGNPSR